MQLGNVTVQRLWVGNLRLWGLSQLCESTEFHQRVPFILLRTSFQEFISDSVPQCGPSAGGAWAVTPGCHPALLQHPQGFPTCHCHPTHNGEPSHSWGLRKGGNEEGSRTQSCPSDRQIYLCSRLKGALSG